jgi:hypothetical protein
MKKLQKDLWAGWRRKSKRWRVLSYFQPPFDLIATFVFERPGPAADNDHPLSPDQQTELMFLEHSRRAVRGEGCTLDQSLSEVRNAGNPGSLPLAVITANPQGQPQLVALSLRVASASGQSW